MKKRQEKEVTTYRGIARATECMGCHFLHNKCYREWTLGCEKGVEVWKGLEGWKGLIRDVCPHPNLI